MDNKLRRAERDMLRGSPNGESDYRRMCARVGLYFKDHKPLEDLSEWEEAQEDYDDIWWHRRKALRLDWDGDPINSGGLYKAHHPWGHRGWGSKNSKRKTLRTHRDGSRRQFRLRQGKKDHNQDLGDQQSCET